MPVLKRDDGAQFTIQNYRESLVIKKSALLKREVRFLARAHGDHLRLFKRDLDTLEAVFSRDAGYPLGEVVWRQLGGAANLIYCEALPEDDRAILVIVRDNSVYLDVVVPLNQLVDEFASLVTQQREYDIFTYGDVPLAEVTAEETFSFDDAFVGSFTTLDQPIFSALPTPSDLKLLSADRAISTLGLGNVTKIFSIALLATMLLAFAAYWVVERAEKPVKPVVQVVRDPFLAYELALATPAPEKILQQLAQQWSQFVSLPGWALRSIKLTKQDMVAMLTSEGGSLRMLMAWAKQHGMQVQLQGQNVVLSETLNVIPRPKSMTIHIRHNVIARLSDKVETQLLNAKLTVGNTLVREGYNSTDIQISFSELSPELFISLGRTLQGLPVNLLAMQASTQSGLATGMLKLTVLGK